MTGLTGQAWPELVAGRPAVLYPQASAPDVPALLGDGWSQQDDLDGWAQPNPDWSAVLDARRLRIARLGDLRFDGELPIGWEWRRAARTHRGVLQITGPFTHPGEFAAAVCDKALHLLVAPLTFTADTW